jgi:hypothetical protein
MFREWGFRVEKGPRHTEVTLILEGPDYRSCCVYDVDRLPQIAEVALRVRLANGASEERSAKRRRAAAH